MVPNPVKLTGWLVTPIQWNVFSGWAGNRDRVLKQRNSVFKNKTIFYVLPCFPFYWGKGQGLSLYPWHLLCRLGWPWTHRKLPFPLECWNYRYCHHAWSFIYFCHFFSVCLSICPPMHPGCDRVSLCSFWLSLNSEVDRVALKFRDSVLRLNVYITVPVIFCPFLMKWQDLFMWVFLYSFLGR